MQFEKWHRKCGKYEEWKINKIIIKPNILIKKEVDVYKEFPKKNEYVKEYNGKM